MWPVLESETYLTHCNCGFSHEIMGALNGDSMLIHVGRGIISCKSICQHISRVEIIVWELFRLLHMTNVLVGSIGRRCRGLSFDILLADPVSLHISPKTTLPVPIHTYMHCSAWVYCNRSDFGCVLSSHHFLFCFLLLSGWFNIPEILWALKAKTILAVL